MSESNRLKRSIRRAGLLLAGAVGLAGVPGVLGGGAAHAQAATTFRFSAAAYTGSEQQARFFTRVPITVTRSGNISGESRVNYATSGGTATEGEDYDGDSGVLEFDAGQTSATFYVTLGPDHVDPLLEGPETVNLTLSNPVGGVLGNPSSAVLTILDDPLEPTPLELRFRYRGSALTLAWVDNAVNETGFQIQRAVGDGPFRLRATRPANVTTFNDRVREGTTYTYRVRAVRGDAASEWLAITFTVGRSSQRGFLLRISKTRLNFKPTSVGQHRTGRIDIRNVGRSPVRVRVTGLEAPFTIISGGGDFTLAPRQVQVVRIRFTPPARRRTYRDQLTVAVIREDGSLSGRRIPITARSR